jgi:hypothetical protein
MNGNILLNEPNYNNPKNLLHNNIKEEVLNTQSFDNRIFIDSKYKDFSKYPNPYNFIVKFNGTEPVTKSTSITIDNCLFSYDNFIKGDTQIVIHKNFKNVRHVIVNNLIMPTHLDYTLKDDNTYEKVGCQLGRKNKYLILKIKELENNRRYSNMNNLGKNSFILKIDNDSGINNQFWIPIYSYVCYFDSRLESINRLTIEICDERGRPLCTTLDGEKFDFFEEYRNLIDLAVKLNKKGTPKSCKKLELLLPKLKSLEEIINCLAPEIHLTINTLETQIDTNPNYGY